MSIFVERFAAAGQIWDQEPPQARSGIRNRRRPDLESGAAAGRIQVVAHPFALSGQGARMDASKTLTDLEDLLLYVLKRLPVRSVCRFRCVCKSWNSLLSSTYFITSHHSHTLSSSNHNKSFFLINPCFRFPHALYHPLCSTESGGQRFTYIDPPFTIRGTHSEVTCICFEVFGVINGVVCLATGHDIVVWNPSTHKSLFRKYHHENERRVRATSFGFDATKKDFKVVSILHHSPWYDVLSVRDGLWRRKQLADSIHQLLKNSSNGCFINGTIYWIGHIGAPDYSWKDPTLVLFDCEREEFSTMEFPQHLKTERGVRKLHGTRVFKHDNMLSVLVRLLGGEVEMNELWVMEEGHSWKKLYTFEKSYSELLGQTGGSNSRSYANNLSSKDVSIELGRLQQPLGSLEFEESLHLSDVKAQPLPEVAPLSCERCSPTLTTRRLR